LWLLGNRCSSPDTHPVYGPLPPHPPPTAQQRSHDLAAMSCDSVAYRPYESSAQAFGSHAPSLMSHDQLMTPSVYNNMPVYGPYGGSPDPQAMSCDSTILAASTNGYPRFKIKFLKKIKIIFIFLFLARVTGVLTTPP